MGWFSKQKPMDDQTKAPSKASRKQCWASRDLYFSCLDRINVIDATNLKNRDSINRNCKAEEKSFDDDCATSWVKYFKEKRVADVKRELMLKKMEAEGAQMINLGYVPPSTDKSK